MAEKQSFLSGGTFCKAFCDRLSTDFRVEDYEEPLISLSNLRISGDRGCLKCQILYQACVRLHPSLAEEAHSVLVRVDNYANTIQVVLGDAKEDHRVIGNQEVYLHYLYNTSPPDWVTLQPYRKPSAARKADFQSVLSRWLKDCENNHPKCRKLDQPLPSRVVNVGIKTKTGYDPFLYLSDSGEKGQYAALSHCWGRSSFLKTTTSNMTQHRSRISFATLPINFQHAIIVCRALHIQYLWIDSLSIIQDDGNDWEAEAAKMASIYNNASIVLFASNAADSKGGLWNKKWDKNAAHIDGIEEFPYTNRDGTTSTIIARKSLSHETIIPGPYLEYTAPSPLSTRAWALQEQLLAQRSIFFSGIELLWKCKSDQKCECMQEDFEQADNFRDKDFWDRLHSEDAVERFGGWRSLVAFYSRKDITYHSDRLPAISGLAKYMQDRGLGDYLSGMWRDDLLESLIWLPRPVWPEVHEDDAVSTYRKRTSEYRAPTWSWMSLETYRDGRVKPQCPGIQDWFENHSWKLDTLSAKVLNAACEPAGIDSTGAVKSGHIILETRCVEGLVKWENRRTPLICGSVEIGVHWDIDLDYHHEQKLLCALIGSGDGFRYMALVLQQCMTTKEAYERVGLVQIIPELDGKAASELFEDVPETVVRLI